MPVDILSILAEGPKGSMSSSRTTRPFGFWVKDASVSTGRSESASSWTLSTILPLFLKSVASILNFPRTSLNLKSTISSMDLPTHLSGVPIREVSPNSGGNRGPISTFGYPYLPTNTAGGLEPASSVASIRGRDFCCE